MFQYDFKRVMELYSSLAEDQVPRAWADKQILYFGERVPERVVSAWEAEVTKSKFFQEMAGQADPVLMALAVRMHYLEEHGEEWEH